jgi:hypothetical protein
VIIPFLKLAAFVILAGRFSLDSREQMRFGVENSVVGLFGRGSAGDFLFCGPSLVLDLFIVFIVGLHGKRVIRFQFGHSWVPTLISWVTPFRYYCIG